MTDAPRDELEDVITRLEQTAARLRTGELSGEEAAALVEECAELASRASTELDRRARAGGAEPPAGQGELL